MARDLSTEELVSRLLARAGKGGGTGDLMNVAARHGMRAAKVASKHFEKTESERNELLCKLIARVGRIRKSYLAVVQIYDLAAYEIFYSVKGREIQKRIAMGLPWQKWPPSLPAAIVRAAPSAGLRWLSEQSRLETPDWAHVQALLSEWSRWIHDGNERQYVHHVHTVVASLLEHEDLRTHPQSQVAILSIVSGSRPFGCCNADASAVRLIGGSLLDRFERVAVNAVNSPEATVRSQAMKALARLGSESAEKAFLKRLAEEEDLEVLANAAGASGELKNKEAVGSAMLALFKRVPDANVATAILFTAESAGWPQTESLLLEAFKRPGQGLLGVALTIAAGRDISPRLKREILKAGAEYETLTPALIDALGAVGNEEAALLLGEKLPEEKNEAIRLKLLLALEKCETESARKMLMHRMQEETSPLVMEHLIAIAGRLRLDSAPEVLMNLADDPTAPLTLRSQALWSLGAFNADEVKNFLQTYEPELPEEIQRERSARMLNQSVTLARFRLGLKGSELAVHEQYGNASPSDRLAMLMRLAEARLVHPIIALGLKSHEFIEVYAAIRAAGSLDKHKYGEELKSFEQSKMFDAMLSLPLDLLGLPRYFDKALRGGM